MNSVRLECGDSRLVLRGYAPNSIDGCASDPPYALVSIGARFGAANAAPARSGASGVYRRASAGFMGQAWDTGDTAFDPAFWAEVFRVLKPGAHLCAFGGTRTYHRLVCAIEDAGFEIRDQLAWVYGSGFPKSHDQGGGWGTALKPAFEPIVLARKPLDGTVRNNMARWGVGALNIDACRVAGSDQGALGRWPANLVHDGSEEVVLSFPPAPGQRRAVTGAERAHLTKNAYGEFKGARRGCVPRSDGGSASRFFYAAKASPAERSGSGHPTVKPVALMRWLCRMIAPPGATILDPFAGSGSTGVAAMAEGQHSVLIEQCPIYCGDIARRTGLAA